MRMGARESGLRFATALKGNRRCRLHSNRNTGGAAPYATTIKIIMAEAHSLRSLRPHQDHEDFAFRSAPRVRHVAEVHRMNLAPNLRRTRDCWAINTILPMPKTLKTPLRGLKSIFMNWVIFSKFIESSEICFYYVKTSIRGLTPPPIPS